MCAFQNPTQKSQAGTKEMLQRESNFISHHRAQELDSVRESEREKRGRTLKRKVGDSYKTISLPISHKWVADSVEAWQTNVEFRYECKYDLFMLKNMILLKIKSGQQNVVIL